MNRIGIAIVISICLRWHTGCFVTADDWPMWRRDAGRTNQSPEKIPEVLRLQWKRQLPKVTPAFLKSRLQFDAGYEPIVVGDTVYLSVPHVDAVIAYDTETGDERWRFYTEGPVRLAPVAWRDNLYIGSDDGHLYCLDRRSGEQRWKFRAVPSSRKILGNGRLISVWPIRGGAVVADETVYFAAGVWPLEGVFVYALDATSGDVKWVNDRCGTLYGKQPHAGAEALGGLSPQGYLLIHEDQLLVPCGAGRPATLDRHTGKLLDFSLPTEGRLPGGWFMHLEPEVARDLRRGKVEFDSVINRDLHEGGIHIGKGVDGASTQITLGDQLLDYADGIDGVEGQIHSVLAAGGRIFVSNRDGVIYCFAEKEVSPVIHEPADVSVPRFDEDESSMLGELRELVSFRDGYAIVLGCRSGELAQQLASESDYEVIALADNVADAEAIKRRLYQPEQPASGVSVITSDLVDANLPPYLADLIVAEDWSEQRVGGDSKFLLTLYDRLKPYGGTACFRVRSGQEEMIRGWLGDAGHHEAKVQTEGDWLLIQRDGALPGAVDYTNDWISPDARVRAPLGLLWFGDSVARFKRAPQPSVMGGVMISQDKDWQGEVEKMGSVNDLHRDGTGRFKLLGASYVDVYTGQELSSIEAVSRLDLPQDPDIAFHPPYQFRPPYVEAYRQELESKGEKSNIYPFQLKANKGQMTNPLTGLVEDRVYVKSYGCDGGVDYGQMITMRSATPAFYDKGIESGTINIAGPRSGCTNSIIPANGVLSLPYFYEGCTCSYPLPTGAALVSMPQTFEQWTAWGDCTPDSIVRVGVNFGAPGDRITHAGTLFVDYPSVGGPSPRIQVVTVPENPELFYHHSLFTKGGEGWPWVCASGMQGIESMRVSGLHSGEFMVRLYFIEPQHTESGTRVFDVSIQGEKVLSELDLFESAGGNMKCLIKEVRGVQVDGVCEIVFTANKGSALLSGVEFVSSDLPLDALTEMRTESNP